MKTHAKRRLGTVHWLVTQLLTSCATSLPPLQTVEKIDLKRYNPRGFVVARVNNSTWGMQFIWPFQAEFLITYLSPYYSQTVIGLNQRDYVWIVARTPQIPEVDYQRLRGELTPRAMT